jgi:Lon protease-like protein
MIKSIATTLFPAIYASRVIECEKEKQDWTTLLPIFYYNDTQFPGYRLDLHFFEPRYKLMMQRVVNTNRCFAYVPNFNNYRAAIGDIALIAHVTEVEFLPGSTFER